MRRLGEEDLVVRDLLDFYRKVGFPRSRQMLGDILLCEEPEHLTELDIIEIFAGCFDKSGKVLNEHRGTLSRVLKVALERGMWPRKSKKFFLDLFLLPDLSYEARKAVLARIETFSTLDPQSVHDAIDSFARRAQEEGKELRGSMLMPIRMLIGLLTRRFPGFVEAQGVEILLLWGIYLGPSSESYNHLSRELFELAGDKARILHWREALRILDATYSRSVHTFCILADRVRCYIARQSTERLISIYKNNHGENYGRLALEKLLDRELSLDQLIRLLGHTGDMSGGVFPRNLSQHSDIVYQKIQSRVSDLTLEQLITIWSISPWSRTRCQDLMLVKLSGLDTSEWLSVLARHADHQEWASLMIYSAFQRRDEISRLLVSTPSV